MKSIRIATILAAALTIGGAAAGTARARRGVATGAVTGEPMVADMAGAGRAGAWPTWGRSASARTAWKRACATRWTKATSTRAAPTASHDAIDDLEARQRNECGEGDWRSVGRIAMRYDRIEGWINNEARQGGGWRGW
jgi:hypothetical protein